MLNKIISFTVPVLFYFTTTAQQGIQSGLFQRTSSANSNDVYDTKAWAYTTGAPVRSTPLIKNNSIYFGNTAGYFFSLNKNTGAADWKFYSGYAINSSASSNGNLIFFADNAQTVYALNEKSGAVVWKASFPKKLSYPWRFDYFYSSPVLYKKQLLIGGDDGFVYSLNQSDGKIQWKINIGAIVRTSVNVNNNTAYFGDVNGKLYAVNAQTGKQEWIFSTLGDSLKSEDFGYDRKAILSSPVMHNNKIIFGSRDGFVYCVDTTGKIVWNMNHEISWAISTVAVKDGKVITGTSDGRFVQAIDVNSGIELWKFRVPTLFWASPLIINNKVYIGGFDGQFYCLDLNTGKRISQFFAGGTILSSAVHDNGLVYFGSDNGYVYALTGHADKRIPGVEQLRRYVFYEKGVNTYFRNGSDLRIKNYLNALYFKTIGSDSLIALLNTDIGANSVIVFASDYFPKEILQVGNQSLLRRYLDKGGRIILPGINPLVYTIDEKSKAPSAFNVLAADTVLSIKYGPNDTRAFGGIFTSLPTEKGRAYGLTDFWVSMLFTDEKQVDIVLGKNENGQVTAFIKNYQNRGTLVQLFLNPDTPSNLDVLVKLAEWNLN
jgi:eukaryotic-like serine/threonine-protein kinase